MHKLHHVSILLLVLHVVGCNPSPAPPTPDNTPKIITVNAVAYEDEQPILAYAIAQSTTSPPTPNPGPDPDAPPKVGDTCPNCDGRGTSGDGISPCKPCRGDGKVDEGDPILNPSTPSPAPSTPEEDAVTRGDFEKLQESVVASLHELNKHLKDLEDRANKAFDQTQEGIEANVARINALEASVKALEINLRNHTLDHPAPGKLVPSQEKTLPLDPKSRPKYDYAIQFQGAWFYWDQQSKSFVNLTTKQSIPFPAITDCKDYLGKEVQVCDGTKCSQCKVLAVSPRAQ